MIGIFYLDAVKAIEGDSRLVRKIMPFVEGSSGILDQSTFHVKLHSAVLWLSQGWGMHTGTTSDTPQ